MAGEVAAGVGAAGLLEMELRAGGAGGAAAAGEQELQLEVQHQERRSCSWRRAAGKLGLLEERELWESSSSCRE